ncbi:hypothetical protein D9619_003673 [Psilocybe cf. subviscida]|uniref:MYND-type domain-containing protein n=1 Tax=Psilocybe cf. subviscida TaxID=2480587 RepID=A0A8H5AXN4_9AGAR|nr:hypothetical protein D9619_003673 [Psilocybe cf. subviscida]
MPQIIQNGKGLSTCSNITCFKNGKNADLKYCTRCKLAPYCVLTYGPECQKADWSMHKMCETLSVEKERLDHSSQAGRVVNGVPVAQVSSKFRRWHVAALPIIERCVVAAMDFVNNPNRCFTHAVLITVKTNLTPADLVKKKGQTPADIIKQFSVAYAYICRIDEMPSGHDLESARDTILAGVRASRRARESGSSYGTAFAVVRFPDLMFKQISVLLLPKSFDPKKPRMADWVGELKERIQNGRIS